MYNHSTVLVAAGSLCLTITLVLAWCLAGVRASTFMKRLFPNYQSLLKAHMDYLLMTGLLMIFYFAVRPISCLAIAGDSGGDVPRIAGKPRGMPCVGSQTEPSSTPNQSIWCRNDGQLCSDYSRLHRRRLVRGAGRTTGSVMSWTR
jgi:hypothetical protein